MSRKGFNLMNRMLKIFVAIAIIAIGISVATPANMQAQVIHLGERERPIFIDGVEGRVAPIPEWGDRIQISGSVNSPYHGGWPSREIFAEFFEQDYSFTLGGVPVSVIEFYDVIMTGREGELRMTSGASGTAQPVHPSQLHPWYQEAIDWMLTDEYVYLVRQEFYRLVNEHRLAHGLRQLEVNHYLEVYADIRAGEITYQANILRVRISHTRLDGSRFYSGWNDSNSRAVAENASGGGSLPSCPLQHAYNSFTGWRSSDAHNRIMLLDVEPQVTMAFGISPTLVIGSGGNFRVHSGNIFLLGYGDGAEHRD